MKQFIYIVLVFLMVMGCKNGPRKQTINLEGDNHLTFYSKNYEEKFEQENNREVNIIAEIPVMEGNSHVAQNINTAVFNTIKKTLGVENNKCSNYDELFGDFISDYKNYLSKNPHYDIRWKVEVNGEVGYYNADMVCIKIESNIKTDGPRGNSNTTVLIFDKKDGKELKIADLIKNMEALTKTAEEEFRKKNKISVNNSLNSAGFDFENDTFILPENIFITEDGLVLYYNINEIAAYPIGTTEFVIPYSMIGDNLMFEI